MNDFLLNYWKYISAIIIAVFSFYKFIIKNTDTILNRKKQKIKLLEKITYEYSHNISDFKCSELMNLYYGVDLSTYKMKACMNSHDVKSSINIVIKYDGIISIIDNILIPERMIKLTWNKWFLFIILMFLSVTSLSIYGIYLSGTEFNAVKGGIKIVLTLFSYLIFLLFFILSVREFGSILEARKFFKTYSEFTNIKAQTSPPHS